MHKQLLIRRLLTFLTHVNVAAAELEMFADQNPSFIFDAHAAAAELEMFAAAQVHSDIFDACKCCSS
jgi:hypothetical protein